MRALEFAGTGRKSGEAALALVFVADSPEELDSEFHEAKAALLEWQDKHGSACGTVMFTVTAPPELYGGFTDLLDKVYREDAELAPLLQRVPVNVAVLNAKGKPACEYRLGHEEPQFKAESDKPWWKFW